MLQAGWGKLAVRFCRPTAGRQCSAAFVSISAAFNQISALFQE
jgi:hypothetical protein